MLFLLVNSMSKISKGKAFAAIALIANRYLRLLRPIALFPPDTENEVSEIQRDVFTNIFKVTCCYLYFSFSQDPPNSG
jgi:hypothetical protein